MKSANRTILVAGMGTSPAVLTETVWALAHQEIRTSPTSLQGGNDKYQQGNVTSLCEARLKSWS